MVTAQISALETLYKEQYKELEFLKAEKELITFLLERHNNKYDKELEKCLRSNNMQEKRVALNIVTMQFPKEESTESTISFKNSTVKAAVELPLIKNT